jgi:hypothetical protein
MGGSGAVRARKERLEVKARVPSSRETSLKEWENDSFCQQTKRRRMAFETSEK